MSAVKRPSVIDRVKRNLFMVEKKDCPKTYKEVLKDLAESSSLHGIGKVVSSRQLAVKVLWLLLLLGTMSVFGMQLVELFKTFYSNPVQTTVSLSFSPLKYPAITFCNMNAIKKSLLNETEAIANIFHATEEGSGRRKKRHAEPTNENNKPHIDVTPAIKVEPILEPSDRPMDVNNWKAVLEEHLAQFEHLDKIRPNKAGIADYPDLPGSYLYDGETHGADGANDRVRRGAASMSATVSESASISASASASSAYNSDYNSGDYSSYYDYYSGDSSLAEESSAFFYDQLNSKKDEWEVKIAKFQVEFRNESREDRIKQGHQRDVFIHQASFAGVIQNKSSETLFKTFTTTNYGNCYTMDSPGYIAWRSGPSYGIKVTLNLEIGEYIKNFASGYGVRLVFHTPGTFPFPADEGLTLSPGTETNIGLRMVRVHRLGPPYGDCTDGKEFEATYGYKYSTTACFEFCRTRTIIANCGCIPPTGPDTDLNTTALRICEYKDKTNNGTDQKCTLEVDFRLNSQSSDECECISPCSQEVYEKTVSSRIWPKPDYLEHYLMSDICTDKDTSLKALCERMNASSYDIYEDLDQYQNNFLRFVIYFEDLNFESISEEPLYSGVRFLSDIGGAMGLFMGASVLTYVELLQLLLETLLFCRNKFRGNQQNRVAEMKK